MSNHGPPHLQRLRQWPPTRVLLNDSIARWFPLYFWVDPIRSGVSEITKQSGCGDEEPDDQHPFRQQTTAAHPGPVLSPFHHHFVTSHTLWMHQMEDFIQYELNCPTNRLLDADSINESRWEVFRECFDIFISEFSTYRVETHCAFKCTVSMMIDDLFSMKNTFLNDRRCCFKSRTNTKRS